MAKTPKPDESMTVTFMPPFICRICGNCGGIFPSSDSNMIMRSWCAWYITLCCHKTLQDIPAQVTMEGDTDITVDLRGIADGIAMAYGQTDMNEVMALMPLCRQYAFQKGLGWHDRFQAWLDSGGRAYNEVTREPDAI
jgi:hypothetical protein